MKAVPYAVMGAAVLAGWSSSPHVAFAAEAAEMSVRSTANSVVAQSQVCAAHVPGMAEDAGARRAQLQHVHGSGCGCAACSATTQLSK